MATNPDPNIDLMALADIGGQPRKLAMEIHRQLRIQFGSVPTFVPLEGIARSVGISEIVDHHTESFEGTLLIKGSNGAIVLRKGMKTGRRRFTLGHELGHFLNPWHRTSSQRFECKRMDMHQKRDRSIDWDSKPAVLRMEIEANEFSNALLLPGPEYKVERQKLGRDPSIKSVHNLARLFGVSLEVMCQTYVTTSLQSVAIIISHNGLVVRIIPRSGFPYLGLRKGSPLPHDSLTATFRKSAEPGEITDFVDVLHSGWLDGGRNVTELLEQTMVQNDGYATTLLWAVEDEVDDEADDRNWNRRSSNSY